MFEYASVAADGGIMPHYQDIEVVDDHTVITLDIVVSQIDSQLVVEPTSAMNIAKSYHVTDFHVSPPNHTHTVSH